MHTATIWRLNPILRVLAILSWCAGEIAAQSSFSIKDKIELPVSRTQAAVSLRLLPPPSSDEKLSLLPLINAAGNYLRPQPDLALSINGNKVDLKLDNLYFWGDAKLQIQRDSKHGSNIDTFQLHRGLYVANTKVAAFPNGISEIWLFNETGVPVTARWRIKIGARDLCGWDDQGNPRTECGSGLSPALVEILPGVSHPVRFVVPPYLFGALYPDEKASSDKKGASSPNSILQLSFGESNERIVVQHPIEIRWPNAWYNDPQ
jgi:hypothetical protein